MAIDKQATDQELTAKVASLNGPERWDRLTAIADADDRSSDALLEASKLIFGANAVLAED